MGDDTFWSIGEVLSLLQDEFPEITISKIRFLESQGLIEPERTPSGYRRFYQADFDLLQWILLQQRDHYLPLKVIRDRIRSGDTEQGLLDFTDANGDHSESRTMAAEPVVAQPVASEREAAEPVSAESGTENSSPDPAPSPTTDTDAATDTAAVAVPDHQASAVDPEPDSADNVATEAEIAAESEPEPAAVHPPIALTRDELAESSGCSVKMVSDLERYGLVKGRKAGPVVLYDNTALVISRIAAQFDNYGLEPRHLRTFLIGAEREMGLVHQVVEPMMHRRDEETRRKAHETLDDLTDLAGSLRSILMRQATEELLPKH